MKTAEVLRQIRTKKGIESNAFVDALVAEMSERAGVSKSQVLRVAAEFLAANFDEKLFTNGSKLNDERVSSLIQRTRKARGLPFDENGRGVLSGVCATPSAHRLADDIDIPNLFSTITES
jgi:hypothetical protein